MGGPEIRHRVYLSNMSDDEDDPDQLPSSRDVGARTINFVKWLWNARSKYPNASENVDGSSKQVLDRSRLLQSCSGWTWLDF